MASNRNNNYKVTWAQAVRDIVISAMNRGQLLIIIISCVFLLLIAKLNNQQSYDLLRDFLSLLSDFYLVGWLLWIVTLIGSFLFFRKVRTDFSGEMKRVGLEKSRLQEKNARRKLPSSNRKNK